LASHYRFWPAITGFGRPVLVLAGWPAITGFGRPLLVLAVFRPLPVLAGHYRFWPISTFGRNTYKTLADLSIGIASFEYSVRKMVSVLPPMMIELILVNKGRRLVINADTAGDPHVEKSSFTFSSKEF
jgi:hypothetical protein